MLICEKAYIKEGDKRRMIMCKVSKMICAHAYYCDVVNRFRQKPSAERCPGRDM